MDLIKESTWKENSIAKLEAQKLAFAPFMFQVARIARDSGLLKILEESKEQGLSIDDIESKIDFSKYAVKLLVDTTESIALIEKKGDRYILTKVGYFILNDIITKINMDFTHYVCYMGMFYLEDSFKKGRPEGLKVFGEWSTIYEALSQLPEEVKKSWFNFDHFYSDRVFPKFLSVVFKNSPKKIMDVGGNTGKWAMQCTSYSNEVEVTIVDLSGQISQAKENLANYENKDRISFYQGNILHKDFKFPSGYDVIWMSQFLDCFSEDEIVTILSKARDVMEDSSTLYIVETYTDRQKFEEAKFCLNMTSLYFTCMANGNSKMYNSGDMINCIARAGLKIVDDISVGVSHTLFICKK